MIFLYRRNWFSPLLLFAGFVFALGPHLNAQESSSSVRQRFAIFPAFRPCDPAQVKTFSLGKQPLEAILAQVIVESRSEKVISAIKLGWRVYDEPEGRRISLTSCPPKSSSAEVLLTGTTNVIPLTALGPHETSTVGINPLPVPTRATKTVFVDRPFVTVDDVKSLVVDRENRGVHGKYALVISVSEIQYADGTRWTFESP